MARRHTDNFDYENAERDIWDAGGDPDYLSRYNHEERDRYMNKIGLDPKHYGSTWSSGGDSDSSDDECFLTTACVKAKGLPDDCEELMTLRQYRDTYLRNREGGEADIQKYYDVAPAIVDRINRKRNAVEIWDMVYTDMILPCVEMIRQNKMESVYELYKSYTFRLMEI